MKKAINLFLFLFLALSFTACVDEDEYEDSPSGNFEALWKIMDEHYCFFKEKGVNWDSVHAVYAPRFNAGMTDDQELEVLGELSKELQ